MAMLIMLDVDIGVDASVDVPLDVNVANLLVLADVDEKGWILDVDIDVVDLPVLDRVGATCYMLDVDVDVDDDGGDGDDDDDDDADAVDVDVAGFACSC